MFSIQNNGDRKESTSESSLESSSGYSSQTAISNATHDEGEYIVLIMHWFYNDEHIVNSCTLLVQIILSTSILLYLLSSL